MSSRSGVRDDPKKGPRSAGFRPNQSDRRTLGGESSRGSGGNRSLRGLKAREFAAKATAGDDDVAAETSSRSNRHGNYPKRVVGRSSRRDEEETAATSTQERIRSHESWSKLKGETSIPKLLRLLRHEDDADFVDAVFVQMETALKRLENSAHARQKFSEVAGCLISETKRLSVNGFDLSGPCSKCLGRIGVCMDEDLPKFLRFIRERIASESRPAVRRSCLEGLREIVRFETQWPQLPAVVYPDALVKELKVYLDEAESIELLAPVVDAFAKLAVTHPHEVQPQFEDIVDILIGWHIDENQKEETVAYTSTALASFRPLWSSNLEFSCHLLSEFVDDLNHFTAVVNGDVGDSGQSDRSESPKESHLIKIISLLRVFATVCRCLDFGADDVLDLEMKVFMTNCVKRVAAAAVACLTRFERRKESAVLIAANECLRLLLPFCDFDADTITAVRRVFELMFHAGGTSSRVQPKARQSCLVALHAFMRRGKTLLPEDFLNELVASGSPLLKMRFDAVPEVQTEAQALFRTFMTAKNVNFLNAVYHILLLDLFRAYKALAPSIEFEFPMPSEEDADAGAAVANNVAVAMFVFSALTEIATEKHSILAMWGLKPTIFQLLSAELNPKGIVFEDLAFASSPVFLGHLYLLFSHCSRHGHFTSTSRLLNFTSEEKQPSGEENVAPALFDSSIVAISPLSGASTAGNLEVILDLLDTVLRRALDRAVVPALGCFFMRWAGDVFTAYGKEYDSRAARLGSGNLPPRPETMMSILSAALRGCVHSDVDVCKAAIQCVVAGVQAGLLRTDVTTVSDGCSRSLALWDDVLEVCCYQLGNLDVDLRREVCGLFGKVPLFVRYNAARPASFAAQLLAGSLMDVRGGLVSASSEQGEKWLLSCLRRTRSRLNVPAMPQASPSFHSHHFKYFAAVLLAPLRSSSPCRLADLVEVGRSVHLSCERRDPTEKGAVAVAVGDFVADSDAFLRHGLPLMDWIVWHTAQYCIMTKLRTPFGKPQETLQAIEIAIKAVDQDDVGSNEEASEPGEVGSWDWEFFAEEQTTDGEILKIRTNAERLFKARLVVAFVDALEKLIYNAGPGTSNALTSPPKTVRTFFRTNRATCEEWLNRIRLPVISICLKAGLPGAAVWHATALLRDGKLARALSAADADEVICAAAAALVQLGSSVGISGLAALAKTAFPAHSAWLEGARLQAAGSFEAASEVYLDVLQETSSTGGNLETSVPACAAVKISRLLEDSYVAVGNWDEAIVWCGKRDEVLRTMFDGGDLNSPAPCSFRDLCLYRGMSFSDAGAWQEAEENFRASVGEEDPLDWSSKSLARAAECSLLAGLSVVGNPSAVEVSWKEEARKFARRSRAALNGSTAADLWANWPPSSSPDGLFAPCSGLPVLKVLVEVLERDTDPERRSCGGVSFFSRFPDDVKNPALIKTMVSYAAVLHGRGGDEGQLRKWWSCGCCEPLLFDAVRVSREMRNFNLCGRLLCALSGDDEAFSDGNDFDGQRGLSLKLAKTVVEGIRLQFEQRSINRVMAVSLMAASVKGMAAKLATLSRPPRDARLVADFRDLCSSSLGKLCCWLAPEAARFWDGGTLDEDVSVMLPAATELRDELAASRGGYMFDSTFPDGLKALVFGSPEGQLRGVVGQLLHLGATSVSAEDRSGWNTFADWAFRVGRDALIALRADPSSIVEDERSALDRLFPPLSTESRAERVKIEALLAQHWALSMSTGASSSSPSSSSSAVEDGSNVAPGEWVDENDARDKLRDDLIQQCPWLVTPNRRELLEQVLNIADEGISRAFSYHAACVEAYFRCLTLSDRSSPEGSHRLMDDAKATLRILSLAVRYAGHARHVFDCGFARTPTAPWKAIIPQLFASLSNPNALVRKWLSDLVCRLAGDYPHLIVFPAVVGASCTSLPGRTDKRAKDIWDNYDESDQQTKVEDEDGAAAPVTSLAPDAAEPDVATGIGDVSVAAAAVVVDDDDEDEDNNVDEDYEEGLNPGKSKKLFGEDAEVDDGGSEVLVNTCYVALLDTLAKTNREHVMEVETLVRELRRITLLWDEAWLGSVLHNLPYLNRRLTQLEAEVRKLQGNEFLSPEEKRTIVRGKFDILVKPVLFVLEQLHEITSGEAETKHESWFQEKFGSVIESTLHCLRNPKRPEKPKDTLNDVVALEQWLQQKGSSEKHRGSAGNTLRLPDISPTLAALKDTMIAIPGNVNAARGKRDWVTIAGFETVVQILPTKTRPKKLVVQGSDGKKYPFLFKGLEDLHLDERIMQFLRIVNYTLAAEQGPDDLLYEARHYSVTPLGPRGGLIEWVEGGTPLFSLYKRWQQREAAAAAAVAAAAAATTPAPAANGGGQQSASAANQAPGKQADQQVPQQQQPPPAPLRPSDMFYRKLAPLLKEKDIKIENRKNWPLPILRQVLAQLMAETPRDLFARELWAYNLTASSWWLTNQVYCSSTAVMSIIGYVIGLGDRHLDNILLDLSTGQVVHIDYNVCFDKGKTLRVPERVPFRLTPNIETALGLTGVEGPFRLGCEHVLKTVRKGKDTLLELLEAFVYDPLVDWTHLGTETMCEASLLLYGAGRNLKDAAALQESALARRREMTRALTRQMFALRLAEVRAEWLANRDDLAAALPELTGALEARAATERELASVEQRMREGHEALVLLKEAESSPGHPLHSLGGRHARHVVHETATSVAVAAVEKALVGYQDCFVQREKAFGHLQSEHFRSWLDESKKLARYCETPSGCFSVVKDFLAQVGKTKLFEECELAEVELKESLRTVVAEVNSTLEMLRHYAAVACMYPRGHASKNWLHFFDACLRKLLKNFTLETCREIASEYQRRRATYLPGNPPNDDGIVAVVHVACLMRKLMLEMRGKQHEILRCQELERSQAGPSAREAEHAMLEFLQWMSNLPSNPEDPELDAIIFAMKRRRVASMEAVIVSVLTGLCKQLLLMEKTVAQCSQPPTAWTFVESPSSAAANSGKNLYCSASPWFLISSSIDGLARVLAWSPGEASHAGSGPAEFSGDDASVFHGSARRAAHCILKIRPIYLRLQDLSVSVESIILPETIALLLAENPSMLAAMDALSTIMLRALGQADDAKATRNYSVTLQPLIDEMELYLHYLILGVEPDNVSNAVIAERLINEYWGLLNSNASTANGDGGGGSGSADADVAPVVGDGVKLLNAFNGLFKSLEDALHDLLMTFGTFEIPEQWKKVDVVSEAAALMGPVFNPVTLKTLSDIFLLKRIQSIYEFFAINQQICRMWRGESPTPVLLHLISSLSLEDLMAPVRRYCGDFFRRLVLGVPSQILAYMLCVVLELSAGVDVVVAATAAADDEQAAGATSPDGDVSTEPSSATATRVDLENQCRALCARLFPAAVSGGDAVVAVGAAGIDPGDGGVNLGDLSALISQYDATVVRADKARGLHAEMTGIKTQIERWELIESSQLWFEEQSLKFAPFVSSLVGPELSGLIAAEGRALFMDELGRLAAALSTAAADICDRRAAAIRHVESVRQRLRWAVGANPDGVRDLVEDFERRVLLMTETADAAVAVAGCLSSTADVVFLDELLRHSDPAAAAVESVVAVRDSEFISLLKTCSDACALVEKFDTEHGGGSRGPGEGSVSALEKKLAEFVPIGPLGVDEVWITEVSDKVRDDIGEVQTKIGEVRAEVASKREVVVGKARKVRALFAHHRQLMHGVKPMLKTMAKWKDEYAGGIGNYLKRHAEFCAEIHRVVALLVGEVPSEISSLESVFQLLTRVAESLPGIYEDLWSLATPQSRGGVRILDAVSEEAGDEAETKSRRHSKRGESVSFVYSGVEPNKFALSVWKRLKAKLEGRDSELSRDPLSVEQQVASLIEEARDLDNLALLYEGWTPWV